MDCENVPTEMVEQFDQPWSFMGEVKEGTPYLGVCCGKCNKQTSYAQKLPVLELPKPFRTVDLQRYLFITDDMLEVAIYFGVCKECDTVYWARQGPPFKRARCLIPA